MKCALHAFLILKVQYKGLDDLSRQMYDNYKIVLRDRRYGKMTNRFPPQEQIQVFISSAQRNENGFAWGQVRRAIRDRLQECPYLNPFIIEDVARSTSSTQTYEKQVARSDIVVTLIKGDVRPGTAAEYAIARRYNKPILLYFLRSDQTSLSVDMFKQEIKRADCCTYRYLETFDNMEDQVFHDVMDDLITFYKNEHFIFPLPEQVISIPEENSLSEKRISLPTKTMIDLFAGCYDHALELLDIPVLKDGDEQSSVLQDFGIAALDWLITGTPIKERTGILNLIVQSCAIFNTTDWLAKRWDVILAQMDGDPKRARDLSFEALNMAKSNNLPKWLLNDMLVDCRNLDNEAGNIDHIPFVFGEAQKELNQLDTIVYLPVADRYAKDAYADMLAEETRIVTQSPFTRHYGSRLGSVTSNILNYFFFALICGSYTHMLVSRKLLSDLLLKYASLEQSPKLLFDAIKLLVLHGDSDSYKKSVDHFWDEIYPFAVTQADDLWTLTGRVSASRRDTMRLAFLSDFGMYLSDPVFEAAVQYLQDFSHEVYWGNSEAFFKCIYENVYRIGSENTIVLILDVIREQRFHLGGTLSSIIAQLRLKDVPPTIQDNFCVALQEKISFILEHNGDPQIIPALGKQNPCFSALLEAPGVSLDDYQMLLYDINMDKGDWGAVLLSYINAARAQLQRYRNEGVLAYSFILHYQSIAMVVTKHYQEPMAVILNENFFPFCSDLITGRTDVHLMNDCLGCLCAVLTVFKERGLSIPAALVDAVKSIPSENPTIALSGIDSSETVYHCHLQTLRLILGIADREELLPWCISYAKKSVHERIALSRSVVLIIRCEKAAGQQPDIVILSLALQCLEDSERYTRMAACDSLAYLLGTNHHDQAVQGLNKAAIDPSHLVRAQVLTLCRDGKISDSAVRGRLVRYLQNDAHYQIKSIAASLI